MLDDGEGGVWVMVWVWVCWCESKYSSEGMARQTWCDVTVLVCGGWVRSGQRGRRLLLRLEADGRARSP